MPAEPAERRQNAMPQPAGLVEGRLDAGVLSSGQVAGVIDDIPSVAELIARITTEAEQTLKHLGELT